MDRIYIVGAGPAGLTTSFFLSREIPSSSITVFDHRRKPGVPPHCTSIVGIETAEFYKEILGEKVIEKKYYSITFHTPTRKYTVYSKKPIAYRLARPYLEQKLCDKLLDMGVEIRLGEHVLPARPGALVAGGKEYEGLVIAADGAYSLFRKKYCGWMPETITGLQRIVRVDKRLENSFHVFFDLDTPCFYQWIVPVDGDKTVLVGYADCRIRSDPNRIFDKVLRKAGLRPLSSERIFGGPIIRDLPHRPYNIGGRIYFVGDSLPASKPVTGGGLYGIKELVPALTRAIVKGDPRIYDQSVERLRKRFRKSWFLTRLFKHKYWVIADLFSVFQGEFEPGLFDLHEKIIWRALPRLPTLLYILLRSLFIRTRRSRG